MEPLINRDEYIKKVNKLTNSFPINLLIGSLIIVVLYHSIGITFFAEPGELFSFNMLSESFFQGTVITVVIYLFKSRALGGVVRTKPTDFTTKEVQGYLPVVAGTNIYKQKAGYLLVEDHELTLHLKMAGGYVCRETWSDLSKVEISVVKETYNMVMLFVFGFRESIQITDGVTTVKVLFPDATVYAKEIQESINSYIQ